MKTNIPDLTTRSPGSGKTTAIAKAAKEIGAHLVVHSTQEKFRIEQEFGIKCVTFHQNVKGMREPFLIDTHAASIASYGYEKEIEALKARVAELEKRELDGNTAIEILMNSNAKLLEVVRFYADEKNWRRSDQAYSDAEEYKAICDSDADGVLGGKRARAVLKELSIENANDPSVSERGVE